MRRVAAFFALACVVCLGAEGPTWAAAASDVEDLVRQGLDLRRAGRDASALPFFRKAYEGERTPRTAGQLGLCELGLGYWVDAEEHLGEALASSGSPWVDKNRETLANALASARANVGFLSVMGGPPGAKVFLDNREVGALPLDKPLRLNKGPHDIEVRAPGPVTRSTTMVVRGGDEQTVTMALEAAPLPKLAPPPPSVEIGTPAPVTSSSSRTLPWVVGGVAVAAAAFAVIETVSWASNLDKFNNHASGADPTKKDCGISDPMYGGAGCAAIHDDLARARTLAIVGYGATVALAVTSIILFEASRPPEAKTNTAFTCAPDLAGKGLSCRMAF